MEERAIRPLPRIAFRPFGLLALLVATCAHSAQYEVPLFMPYDHPVSGSVLRVYGITGTAMPEQTIQITGYDDEGAQYGPITYRGGRARLNSRDIEQGNPAKGLHEGLGDGEGNWRLVLSTLDNLLAVRVYATNRRTGNGRTFTPIHHLAQFLPAAPGRPHPEHFAAVDWRLRWVVHTLSVRIFNRTVNQVRVQMQMTGVGAYAELLLEPYEAVNLTSDALIKMMDAQWVFDQGTIEPGLILRLVDEDAQASDIGVMVLALNHSGSLTNLSGPPVRAADGAAPARMSKGEFDISLDFMEGLHEDWRRAARYAADRLEQIILSDYPTSFVNRVCGIEVPPDRRRVDDLIIRIEWDDPGPTHVAGHARTCSSIRTAGFRGGRPNSGVVTIPWADGEIRDAKHADRVLIHEMLHVLGIGSGQVWSRSGFTRLNNARPSFTGTAALRQFQRLFPRRYDSAMRIGFSGVPLEDDGTHWRGTAIGADATFTVLDDIMLPGGTRNQNDSITAVTIGALEDLGYEVDYEVAD